MWVFEAEQQAYDIGGVMIGGSPAAMENYVEWSAPLDIPMMGSKHTGEFSIEYYPMLLDIFDYNMVHMCGKVTPHMERNVEAFKTLDRLNMINVGPEGDLPKMRELFEPEIGVAGNIDHIQLLPLGTAEEVRVACAACIANAGGHQARHFMLSPGCEITTDTPPENIQAFVDAARL